MVKKNTYIKRISFVGVLALFASLCTLRGAEEKNSISGDVKEDTIVVFGGVKAGKSTFVASMLCQMKYVEKEEKMRNGRTKTTRTFVPTDTSEDNNIPVIATNVSHGTRGTENSDIYKGKGDSEGLIFIDTRGFDPLGNDVGEVKALREMNTIITDNKDGIKGFVWVTDDTDWTAHLSGVPDILEQFLSHFIKDDQIEHFAQSCCIVYKNSIPRKEEFMPIQEEYLIDFYKKASEGSLQNSKKFFDAIVQKGNDNEEVYYSFEEGYFFPCAPNNYPKNELITRMKAFPGLSPNCFKPLKLSQKVKKEVEDEKGRLRRQWWGRFFKKAYQTVEKNPKIAQAFVSVLFFGIFFIFKRPTLWKKLFGFLYPQAGSLKDHAGSPKNDD